MHETVRYACNPAVMHEPHHLSVLDSMLSLTFSRLKGQCCSSACSLKNLCLINLVATKVGPSTVPYESKTWRQERYTCILIEIH